MSKGIPHPGATLPSMSVSVLAMKERIDELTNDHGDIKKSAVTFADLMALGLIQESDLVMIKRRRSQ